MVANRKEGNGTYLTTWGAITLQGPHQVAKQSRTTMSFLRASVKAALLHCVVSCCLLSSFLSGVVMGR